VVPLRPLGVGEILDGAITYVRANPKATLGLAAIIAVIGSLVQFVLMLAVFRNITSAASATGGLDPLTGATAVDPVMTETEAIGLLASLAGVVAITVVVQFVLQTIGTGMLTHVLGRAVLGERLTMGQAWRLVRPQIWRLFAVTILVGLLITAVATACLVPGVLLLFVDSAQGLGVVLLLLGMLAAGVLSVWLYTRLGLVSPALVLENAGPITAMRRSAALVSGSWWRVFGILLLAAVVANIVAGVLSVPFSLAGTLLGGAFGDTELAAIGASLFLSSIGSVVSAAVVVPFTAGVTALLYIDRRMRREGLDLVLQRSALGTAPGAAPGAPGTPPAGPLQTW